MNTSIEQIRPETLALLEKQAETFGMSVDEYLRSILPNGENNSSLEAEKSDDEFEADMKEFASGTENLNNYSGTYSREDIYFDHD
ncbi:MAG: hypothetical protein R2747_24885 [Pyrinomonadaceae bacterium]